MSPPEPLVRLLAAQRDALARAREPADAARTLRAAFPGWSPDEARVALYPEFVYHHVADTLARVHPVSKGSLEPAAWDELVAGFYATRPARTFDLNGLAAGFHDHVRGRGEAPAWLADALRLEWAELAVARAPDPAPPERLGPNPTLELLEAPWRLFAWRTSTVTPRPAPEAGDEALLVWRHPRTLRVRFVAASARALLALKVAAESLDPAEVARAGGTTEAAVREVLREHVEHGLLVEPA